MGTWEHRAILEGNKDPPGRPLFESNYQMAASGGERSRRSYGKNGTVNGLSMLYLIVTNYFITLAKGSCK